MNTSAAKSVRHIECACGFNGYFFNVGLRYLNLSRTTASGGCYKTEKWKLEITPSIARKLEEIAELYRCDDANRTWSIVQQIFNQYHPAFTGEYSDNNS